VSHDIIDNREEKLVEHIKRLLDDSKRAKFAVGYFFAEGLKPIIDKLKNLEEIKLLIGSSTTKETLEALALGYRRLEKAREEVERRSFLTYQEKRLELEKDRKFIERIVAGLSQTDENENLIKKIAHLVERDKLKVKIYLKEPLHAKVYIFDFKSGYYSGTAIVGSSNLTLAGLVGNTELNVVVSGNENHAKLTQWFERLWDEGEDFKEELINVLKNSWAISEPSPYELYLKVIYELVRDRLELEEIKIRRKISLPDLYQYQKDAVAQAKEILERYNGVFIADVVGLGKTYIASALLAHYWDKEGARALIICPPKLIPNWERVTYGFGIPMQGRIFSTGKIDKILENEQLMRETKIVVVDESHHFRSPTAQRYQDLAEVTFGKKVILVTATPYNLSPDDIYHQIKLFHPQEWTEIPIDPPVLRKFFTKVKNGEKDLKDILWHILIRRTRRDIKTYYREDIERRGIKFPQRKGPYRIDYSIDEVYPGIYDEVIFYLKQLKYARYNLGKYVKRQYKDEEDLQLLQRIYPQLKAILRCVVLKRFESSVEAFRETLDNFIKIYKAFLKAVEGGIIPAGPESEDLIEALIEGDDETFQKLAKEHGVKYPIEKFNIKELKSDLEYDIEILNKLFSLVKNLKPDSDAKLQTLIERLKRKEFRDRKILIFTQFEATERYLAQELNKVFEKVAGVSSDTSKLHEVVKRFAPKANNVSVLPEKEIRILVSTDILSEGLNLQDCNVVINYDLHWNPVRLIQRVGRIDRVSTEHEEIWVYNFFPERAVDKHLSLADRVKRRMQEIQTYIGEDSKFLTPEEKIQEHQFFAIYQERANALEEEEGEVANFESYVQKLRELKKEHPELFRKIKSMPPKIRSSKVYEGEKGIIVFCKYGDFYRFYFVSEGQREIENLDFIKALKIMETSPGVRRARLAPNFNRKVLEVEKRFEQEVRKWEQELENKENDPLIRIVINKLKSMIRGESDKVKEKITQLKVMILNQVLSLSQRKAIRRLVRDKKISKSEFFQKLEAILQKHQEEVGSVVSKKEKFIEIVCSESLV